MATEKSGVVSSTVVFTFYLLSTRYMSCVFSNEILLISVHNKLSYNFT